jgi:hypothetical protein
MVISNGRAEDIVAVAAAAACNLANSSAKGRPNGLVDVTESKGAPVDVATTIAWGG